MRKLFLEFKVSSLSESKEGKPEMLTQRFGTSRKKIIIYNNHRNNRERNKETERKRKKEREKEPEGERERARALTLETGVTSRTPRETWWRLLRVD